MKYFLLVALFYFNTQSAYACYGFGLEKSEIQVLMTELEAKIKESESVKGQNIVNILWSDIKTSSGREGDCEAMSLTSKVSVTIKKSENKYCEYQGSVGISKSEEFGNSTSVQLKKDELCQ